MFGTFKGIHNSWRAWHQTLEVRFFLFCFLIQTVSGAGLVYPIHVKSIHMKVVKSHVKFVILNWDAFRQQVNNGASEKAISYLHTKLWTWAAPVFCIKGIWKIYNILISRKHLIIYWIKYYCGKYNLVVQEVVYWHWQQIVQLTGQRIDIYWDCFLVGKKR